MREREGERRAVEGRIKKGRRSGGEGRRCEEVLKEEMRAGSGIYMPIA